MVSGIVSLAGMSLTISRRCLGAERPDDAAREPTSKWAWSDLSDWVDDETKSPNVTAIDVAIPRGIINDIYRPAEPIEFRIDDRKTLEMFDLSHPHAPMRYVLPDAEDSPIGSYGGAANVGTVLITFPNRRVRVLLSIAGFVLDWDTAAVHRLFFSARLAYLLDGMCEKLTGRRFPEKLVQALAGENEMELEKESALKRLRGL